MLACPVCSLLCDEGPRTCPRCGGMLEPTAQPAPSRGCSALGFAGLGAVAGGLGSVWFAVVLWGYDRVLGEGNLFVWAFTVGSFGALALALRITKPKTVLVIRTPRPSAASKNPLVDAAVAAFFYGLGGWALYGAKDWGRLGREGDDIVAWSYLLLGRWGPAVLAWTLASVLLWHAVQGWRRRRRTTG
jgi:hypothetical protein